MINILEQIVEEPKQIIEIVEPNNFEPIGDICSRTSLLLYWYDKHPKKKKPFEPYFPTDTGFGVYHPKKRINPIIKDIHDTFQIDKYNNIYGGHTTINSPTLIEPIHMFHNRSILRPKGTLKKFGRGFPRGSRY